MARAPQLLDRWGNPVQRSELTKPITTPTIGSLRAPLAGYPADGLNPMRLAGILREADAGSALRYLEVAEVIEERDLHYLGVLSTRKRSVSQLDISVKAASDDPKDVARADLIRKWLERDELQDELFDILDCIGKGYSVTEIEWTKLDGNWWPEKLSRRDPKGFRFDRRDLQTPLQVTDMGKEEPLDPFRFIYAEIKAKSGLPLRSGLARAATWAYMFKAFTLRDWAIFTQTYGQPLRVGKWQSGASAEDKETLFKAVANIAGDCAAIIPQGMEIEFIEAKNVGSASGIYKERADWIDQQLSKAIIGQTATTDAVTGGLGSGKEHRQVQEDIERADAKALSAILNRDLIRPWMELEFPSATEYPRLVVGREDSEDLELLASALGTLVPLGMEVSMDEVRGKYGLSEPKPGDAILGQNHETEPKDPKPLSPHDLNRALKRFSGKFKRVQAVSGTPAAVQALSPSQAIFGTSSAEDILADRLMDEGSKAFQPILNALEAMLDRAGSHEEFREMLLNSFAYLDVSDLASLLGQAMVAGHLGGRAVIDEATDD